MKLGIQLHAARVSLSDTVQTIEQFGVDQLSIVGYKIQVTAN